MSRLASENLKMDETNALLQQVPGLGFNTSNLVKTVGGEGGKVDPKTLQVEDTNAAVSQILGNGFVVEQLSEGKRVASNKGRRKIEEALAILQDASQQLRSSSARERVAIRISEISKTLL